MSDGFVFPTSSSFDAALQRLASTSKKSAIDVMRQQARLLFVEVAKITPPGGGKAGETQYGKSAEKVGKLAINRDVHQVYGTPRRAFEDLKATNPSEAGAFWSAYKEGRTAAAAAIVKRELGKSFAPFDGGKVSRSMLGKYIGKDRRKKVIFYITDPANLDAYIKNIQTHVWWLASGWSEALKALGAKLPYGVGKHQSPGQLKVTVTDQMIDITMTNDVRYARQIKNLQSQIDFAMKVRRGSLDRQWQDWMNRLARTSGFRAS